MISLAFQRQNSIRPSVHSSGDSTRKVNAKERKPRIWDRIDQPPHQGCSFRYEVVILASKWNNPDVGHLPSELRDSIAEQPRAINNVPRCNIPSGCFEQRSHQRSCAHRVHDSKGEPARLSILNSSLNLRHTLRWSVIAVKGASKPRIPQQLG